VNGRKLTRILLGTLWVLLLLVVVGVASALTAGVALTISNKSASRVEGAAVAYEVGEIIVGPLAPGDSETEWLGKLGEGVMLDIRIREHGQCFEEFVDVYFFGLSPWTFVNVELLEGQRARVYEREKYAKEVQLKPAAGCGPLSVKPPRSESIRSARSTVHQAAEDAGARSFGMSHDEIRGQFEQGGSPSKEEKVQRRQGIDEKTRIELMMGNYPEQ
jgi:hypothetical protein